METPVKMICQELSAKSEGENERSASGEGKASREPPFLSSCPLSPSLLPPSPSIKDPAHAMLGRDPGGRSHWASQRQRERSPQKATGGDPLSVGGQMGPGKEPALLYCCPEEGRRRRMPISLGVWAGNWGDHQRILCSLAWSCSCTKQATHPPPRARLTPPRACIRSASFPLPALRSIFKCRGVSRFCGT